MGAAAQPRRFTPADLTVWRELTDPRISADGERAVYLDNRRLAVAATHGRSPGRIIGGTGDASPRWSPDGTRVAYISGRAGAAQIVVRAIDAGGERQVTRGGAAVLALAWSPDGKTLAYTARAEEPMANIGWAPAVLLAQLRRARTRLYTVAAEGGEAREAAALGKLEPVGEPAWMPDGRSLLLALAEPFDPERPLEGPELYSLRLDGQEPRRLTHHPGADFNPLPAPDGRRIAWLGREAAQQSYTPAKLWVANADGSRARPLAGELDREPENPQWSADSRTLYFVAEDRGQSHVYAARNDGSVRQVTRGSERLRGLAVADNGRAVTVRSPEELETFAVDLPGQEPAVLAAPNRELLAGRETGAVEGFGYPSGGRTIDAWVTRPPGFEAGKKYPLLLDIDEEGGGFVRMCGGEFRLRSQVLAAAGLVVLCVNPRGAPGYGEAFGNVIRTGFPGDSFDDLMAGVEAAVGKGYVDSARVSIAGGVLAAWAIGHTDRFRSAVAIRPVVDFAPRVVETEDGAVRAEQWMGALPWGDPEQYVKHSPLYFAGNFKTPTLVIGREGDGQATELYFALRSRKVDCALLRTADRVAELEALLGWVGR